MTREEAINRICFMRNDNDFETTKELISKIYNSFEQRTCERCKYVLKYNGDDHECGLLMSLSATQAKVYIMEGFGCNRWEKKDD